MNPDADESYHMADTLSDRQADRDWWVSNCRVWAVNRVNCVPAEAALFSETDFGHSHVSVSCACLWRFKTCNFCHARRNPIFP